MMLDAFGSSASIDVDNDGKIALVCYDIQGDNATNPESFIGGYFYGGDLMSDLNGADMLNIDTYLMQLNQMPGIYDIMVHEFQHLINFAWYVETETEMPVYLNEAYSEAAGHLIYGYASKNSRVSTFNYSTDIKNGLSLVEWEGTLDNYALAYLFGQYIRTQFGNSTIYKQVVSTPAVTKSYLQLIADKLGVSVPDLLFNFRAALEIKAKTGPYGFKGEVFMDSVTTKACTSSSVTSLAPSTAIYKDIYTTSVQLPTNAGPDVRFLFISYTKDPFIESVSYNPATSAASVSVKNIGSTGGTLYVTGYKDENGGRKMTGVYLIPATAGQTEINWQNSFPAGTGYVKTIFLQNTTLKPLSEGKAA